MAHRMAAHRNSIIFTSLALLFVVAGVYWAWLKDTEFCCAFPEEPVAQPNPDMGLVTSLPLYWSLGADFDALASGEAEVPWQRAALEQRFDLVLLDTLSPTAGLDPEAGPVDPLVGLSNIAVVQPRGLSPQDNVALDQWVRAGGRLLLVLDPLLSGQYDLALGDPRRPIDSALVPPVLVRWGLEMRFDEAQEAVRAVEVPFGGGLVEIAYAGELRELDEMRNDCTISAEGALAVCKVGAGRVTVLADAALFEHRRGSDDHTSQTDQAAPLIDLLDFAFSP